MPNPSRRARSRPGPARRFGAVLGAVLLTATLAACGSRGNGDNDSGSRDRLTIGIKFDQPGLGLKEPNGSYSGFDVEVAKYVAKQLGVDESNITWKGRSPPSESR